MGRSRSTPGLLESKSQQNLASGAASCPDSGDMDEAIKRSSDPDDESRLAPQKKLINSRQRESDAQTSEPRLDSVFADTHNVRPTVTFPANESLASVSSSAQVLYPPPPTYTSVTCVQPHILSDQTLGPNISFLPPDASSSFSLSLTPAPVTPHSSPGQHYFLTASPAAHQSQRRTSSPHIESPSAGDTGLLSSPGAQFLQQSEGVSAGHSFSCLTTDGPSPRSRTPLPGELSQEGLIHEIRRLRERLQTLEQENTSMSVILSQQQFRVENRLAEIEQHISSTTAAATPSLTGTSATGPIVHPQSGTAAHTTLSSPSSATSLSPTASGSSSFDDSERNKESII